ncbi:MAG: gliding motility-associated C-terminal domain-containing protein [Bacteroidetes bacterium]|nr:gliding motility-associated C-terminal domain-containing protein [Bacteroidota bacterium]
MSRFLLFFLLMLYGGSQISAQEKYMNQWYWAEKSALDFNSGNAQIKSHPYRGYSTASACIAEKITGDLEFYTFGEEIYNFKHEIIGSTGIPFAKVTDLVVIPDAEKDRIYTLVLLEQIGVGNQRMRAFEIDMQANDGKGKLTGENSVGSKSPDNLMNRFSAVKHCYLNGYWIQTIANSGVFKAFYINGSGHISDPVITAHNQLFPVNYAGQMGASPDGKWLCFTPYSDLPENAPYLFKFNTRCGTFDANFAQELHAEKNWTRAHGVAFSPNNKLLYITYGYQESQLVQYEIENISNYFLIAESPENFNQMALAPDGKIYISTHISGIPSNKLDVIEKPNNIGKGCSYKGDIIRTVGVTNFHMPKFISSWNGECRIKGDFEVKIGENHCAGSPIEFDIISDEMPDSLLWDFKDPNTPGVVSYLKNSIHIYSKPGIYFPVLIIWQCGIRDTLHFKLEVDDVTKPDLGNDRGFCKGETVTLVPANADADLWLWNNGSRDSVLQTQNAGTYWVIAVRGKCKKMDTISISQFPTLQMILGEEYFICEDEDDLVLLDAGEGYKRYKWQPTNDTTQWIIVDKTGEYFVFVEDSRGCKDEAGTMVKTLCNMKVWFPSSFTPNGDGLNDVFAGNGENITGIEVLIFNRWGEEVFHSYNIQDGWDGNYLGNKAAEGAYVWKVRATGFLNKKKVINNYYGTVELLR